MRTKKAFAITAALLMLLAVFTVVGMTSVMGNSDDYDQTYEQTLAKGKPQPPAVQTYTMKDINGRNINFGTVSIWNDNKYLYIKAETWNPWNLWYFRAAVATTLAGIPTDAQGYPYSVGWPYSIINQPADDVSSAVLKIPLIWAKGTQLYISAFASAANGADTSNWVVDYPGSYQYPGAGPNQSGLYPHYIIYTVTGKGR